jgi:hypothetical protein
MGMTGSSHDNEALNAVRLANKWLADKGHNWADLLEGKVVVEADPFAIPSGRPATANNSDYSKSQPAPTPRYRPPPPPPPPPRYHTNALEINVYFNDLEFVSLPSHLQQRVNDIEQRWKRDGKLIDADYNQLSGIHIQYKPRTPRRKRRY